MIVASNYNLEDLVNAGTFRTDLYYRLNILNFRLLPLRERPLDIEYLARKFALEHGKTHGIPIRGVEADFLGALRKYPWPGNVREMENVIRRAVLYCQRGVLRLNDLPSSIRRSSADPTAASGAPSPILAGTPVLSERVAFQQHQHASNNLGGWPPVTPPPSPADSASRNWPANSLPSRLEPVTHATPELLGAVTDEPKSLEARVDRLECEIIQDCLQQNNQRRKETAAELGISRVTLYNKMKKFGLM